MRIPIILIVLSIFFVSMSVSAQSYDSETIIHSSFTPDGELVPELAAHLNEATTRFQSLPSPVKTLFGNQRMAVEVELNNGRTQSFGIVTERDEVVQVTNHAPSNPTMRIQTSESTLGEIAQSEDVGAAAITAINQGKLTYHGLTTRATVPVVVADVVVWATSVVDTLSRTLGFS